MIRALFLCALLFPATALADGWERTKAIAAEIHADSPRTFYVGCPYTIVTPYRGGGRIDLDGCDYTVADKHSARATRLEWEHIVPASLMPAHVRLCWREDGRNACEQDDPAAQRMIFDLHNVVPSVGQVNAIRSNLRYGEGPETFEPPDCKKGDAARIWLYMVVAHGVEIMPAEMAMFLRWSEADPVSSWESERERRIGDYSRVRNPFIAGRTPDPAGACSWE